MNRLTIKIIFISIIAVFLTFQHVPTMNKFSFDRGLTFSVNDAGTDNSDISLKYGNLPLYFIRNEGQVDAHAFFYAKTPRYNLWLTEEGLVFDSFRKSSRRIEKNQSFLSEPRSCASPVTYERDVSKCIFRNAHKEPEIIPLDPTDYKVNYFIGNDRSKWHRNIQTSKAVLYTDLYSNIDLKVYGTGGQIEFDFVVKPSGSVSDICFEYKEVEESVIDEEGNLIVQTAKGQLKHLKPICYQTIKGEKIITEGKFVNIEKNTFGFAVRDYSKEYDLIIDPLILVYSTYLGGTMWDVATDIVVDSEGAAYITGRTASDGFPLADPFQSEKAIGDSDAFISKINPEGTALVYSTYLGGAQWDVGISIDADSLGAAYVTGYTGSIDFPTENAIQEISSGGDGFVTKLSPTGSFLIYSTYLGGSGGDQGNAIKVDQEGAAILTGSTTSPDFPLQNPLQGSLYGSLSDVFIVKISPSGETLIYSSYLGGYGAEGGLDLCLDSEGSIYITGTTNSFDFPVKNPVQGGFGGGNSDAFIAKINALGSQLVYSTYLGGAGDDSGSGIDIDAKGAVWITGSTYSTDFPTKKPMQAQSAGLMDLFISKINARGSRLVFSSYLGTPLYDGGSDIVVDKKGAPFIVGTTSSSQFPIKNAIQSTFGGEVDAIILHLHKRGVHLKFSTFWGGSVLDSIQGVSVGTDGAVYVCGYTHSTDFPVKNPIQEFNQGQADAFICKFYIVKSLKNE